MTNLFTFMTNINRLESTKLPRTKQLLKVCLMGFCLILTKLSLASTLTQNDVQQVPLNLGKQLSIHSKSLNEQRDFFVRLPEGYQQTKRNYPVIYLLDANNETLTYMKDLYFHSVNQIERLMARGDIPQSIIVGIPFTSAQWFGNVVGNPEPFRKYLTQELVDYINKSYRTSTNSLLIGQSYSAVFVINALAKNAESFSSYVAIEAVLASGALEKAIDNYQQISTAKANLQILTGGTTMLPETLLLLDEIEKANIAGLNVSFTSFPEESHSSAYYPALNTALRKHFKDFRYPDKEAILSSNFDYQQLVSYYQKREEKYNVPVTDREMQSALFNVIFSYLETKKFDQAFALWPKWQSRNKTYNANRIINHFKRQQDYDAVISMLHHIIKITPNSVSSVDQLASTYQLNNQHNEAKLYQAKATSLLDDIFAKSVDGAQEAGLNRFGYRLLHEKRYQEAVSLFKRITEARPDSINALDSLSDAHKAIDNYPKAIEAIEKAIILAKSRENTNVVPLEQKLEQLSAQFAPK